MVLKPDNGVFDDPDFLAVRDDALTAIAALTWLFPQLR
jgi:hypothetical protein